MLPENLVKRPRILKTTVPHLIDRLDCIQITLTLRSTLHRLYRPPPHTVLVLIGESKDLVPKELVRPSAFAAERACSYLEQHIGRSASTREPSSRHLFSSSP